MALTVEAPVEVKQTDQVSEADIRYGIDEQVKSILREHDPVVFQRTGRFLFREGDEYVRKGDDMERDYLNINVEGWPAQTWKRIVTTAFEEARRKLGGKAVKQSTGARPALRSKLRFLDDILADDTLKAHEKIAATVLFARASDRFECELGERYLAKAGGMGRGSAHRALVKLEEKGYIKWQRGQAGRPRRDGGNARPGRFRLL
jgi:hypothetical protein